MGSELYGDATHQVAQQLINISQLGVADVQGKGHLWGLCYHPHGHESADMYKNFHASLFIAMSNFVDNLMSFNSRSCCTCPLIHDVIEHPVVKEMLERSRVSVTFIEEEPTDNIFIDFYWETSRGDSGKGFRKFSLDDLGFVANNCVTHFARLSSSMDTRLRILLELANFHLFHDTTACRELVW